MGSMLHPVGPLPSGAYWFRRAMVLAVLIVVLAGGWFILGVGGGPSSASLHPGASSTPAPSTSGSSTATPSATTGASHTPSSSHSPAAIALCSDSVIRVAATTDSAAYAAGVKPRLTVSVTNTGKVACKRDIGRAAMSLVVSQGTARIWSSDDCAPGGQAAVNVLQAGQVFSSTVLWTRIASKPGCPSGQPAAAAGSYTVVARNLTLKSVPAPFVLH